MRRPIVAASLILAVTGLLVGSSGCRPDRNKWLAEKEEAAEPAASMAPSMADEEFRRSSRQGSRLPEAKRKLVVAKLGDRTLTLSEFEQMHNALPDAQRFQYSSPQGMREFLGHVVDFEVMAAEARNSGMWRNPRILLFAKLAMVKEMLRAEATSLAPISTVTDADIREAYDRNRERYRSPIRARLSMFVLATEEEAEKQREALVAQGAGDPQAAVAAFAAAAGERSLDDASKGLDGDIGYVTDSSGDDGRDDPLPGILRRAGLALEAVGDISPVIDVGTRYYLLQLTEREGGDMLPLDQAAPIVRQRVLAERQDKALEAYVDKLRAAAKVDIDQAMLARLEAEAAEKKEKSDAPEE